MNILPGIKTHSAWVECDMRFVTPESLSAVRSYAEELCATEEWLYETTMLICLREKGDSHCRFGQHGFARVLRDQTPIDVGMSLERSLQQDAGAN